MAKCSIIFEDGKEDREVSMTIDFDPPVTNGKPTTAQAGGWSLYEYLLKANIRGESLPPQGETK